MCIEISVLTAQPEVDKLKVQIDTLINNGLTHFYIG